MKNLSQRKKGRITKLARANLHVAQKSADANCWSVSLCSISLIFWGKRKRKMTDEEKAYHKNMPVGKNTPGPKDKCQRSGKEKRSVLLLLEQWKHGNRIFMMINSRLGVLQKPFQRPNNNKRFEHDGNIERWIGKSNKKFTDREGRFLVTGWGMISRNCRISNMITSNR